MVHILHKGPAQASVLIQVIFDHTKYNGQDLLKALAVNYDAWEELALCSEENEVAGKMLQVNEYISLRRILPYLDQGISNLTPDVELSEALHAQIFESPAAEVPMRELYREIAQLFRSTFVIYIDLSHLFGEPCMLRYAIRPERDFDAQWDEIRALKSNAQGAVVHQWHLHLDPKERWATCLQSPSSAYLPLYGTQKPDLGSTEITGIAVTKSQESSRWFWSLVSSATSSPSDEGFPRRLASFKEAFSMEPSSIRIE
ncbi:unnamed protein product, partial [Symbiodinium natans]